MVPHLGSVVENAPIRLPDDLLKGCIFKFCSGDQVIQVIDIGLMMLSVMEFQGLLGDVRLERIQCIRQFRQFK